MKKLRFVYIFLTLIALLALASQAYTTPFSTIDPKGTSGPKHTPEPKHTPGAQATQKATEHANKHKGKPEHYKGVILSADSGSITLDVLGSNVTIGLNAETRIHIPGGSGGILQPGLTAMVIAYRDETSNLIASSVQVIPGKPVQVHRVGIVTAYSPGVSITIQAHDGNEYTFSIAADFIILPAERADQLAVGALVTIIAPRDVASTTWTAIGVVVHPAGSGSGAFSTLTPGPSSTPTETETPTTTPTP